MTEEMHHYPLTPADPNSFDGAAFTALLCAAHYERPVKIYHVRFHPGARTRWHAHQGEQTIVITSGRCRYKIGDAPVREAGAGESVRFPPGVLHWHGADPAVAMDHLAINLDVERTDWGRSVSDSEYLETPLPPETA
jgi:quercetin dioxygenase-like cupin family protein